MGDTAAVVNMELLLLLLLTSSVALVRGDCFQHDTDYPGNDVDEGHYNSVASAELCQKDCQADPACHYWTWTPDYHEACWHKTAMTQAISATGLVSGPRDCEDQDWQHIRVLSYNMYGWNALIQNPWKAENMYKAIRMSKPDLLGAQEVENKAGEVAANIGEDYRVAGDSSAGHAIIYRNSAFTLDEWGVEDLEEQDQWGRRTMEWAQFTLKKYNLQIDHFNTHLCVCSADDLLKSAKTIADSIAALRRPSSLVILTGDFNVFDGFEHSKAIQYLTGQLGSTPVLMMDTFRKVNNDSVDGTTFPGAGKIDYILTEVDFAVTDAWIDRHNYGEASDHLPISGIIETLPRP